MKASDKIRLVVNDVHFYTTVEQAQNGVGDHTAQNIAVASALYKLANGREEAKTYNLTEPTSILGRWNGFTIQIDMVQ